MYYSRTCTYCAKIFYTYHDRKERAAQVLYEGIKQHLVEYGEDHKEFEMDEAPSVEVNQMYYEMSEHEEEPSGHYKL